MAYILTLLIFIAIYAIAIYAMKYFSNSRKWNGVFVAAVFMPYVALGVIIYLDVGFFDWNFQNTLPVANVSPFMFTLTFVSLFLPAKLKKTVYGLISLLTIGMIFSTVVNCVYNALIQYKFHAHFLLDYIAHFVLSLFGVYLVRSGQVDLKIKDCLASGSLILGTATIMMLLNVVFDTSFFGLSLNGKHNIYNAVLVESSYLSALIYFAGVCLVLFVGYMYCRCFLPKKTVGGIVEA